MANTATLAIFLAIVFGSIAIQLYLEHRRRTSLHRHLYPDED